MSLNELVQPLLRDTAGSIQLFLPELVLCGTIVVLLLGRMIGGSRRGFSGLIAFAGALIGLWAAMQSWNAVAGARHEIFTGLLVVDSFTVFFRVVLLAFAALFAVFTKLSGIPDREDGADFYSLVLGATLGMCLMASSNHLLMIFLSVEMASVPSYCLAGMLKGRRQSSEAALKYAVYGAGTAGIMLYGISLLAGLLGTAHLPTMAYQLGELIASGIQPGHQAVLALAALMLGVGLAFKLSAVPFHFWCPDVFEGASAEVNAFLSVASKAAALALLIRVAVGFGLVPGDVAETTTAASQESAEESASKLDSNRDAIRASDGQIQFAATQIGNSAPENTESGDSESSSASETVGIVERLEPVRQFTAELIAFIAAITCTFGNLAAYGQSNIKRLLAYSTIAHAGYMMMPVAAGVALIGNRSESAAAAFAAVAFYVVIYLFMNLGAFAVVAFLRNRIRSEEISDYAGLIRDCPGIVVCFALILFSLIGMPPLAGFMTKFVAFAALADAQMWTLLTIGCLNTAISLFYYVRVVKVMTFYEGPDGRPPVSFSLASPAGGFVGILTIPVIVLIVQWSNLFEAAVNAARPLVGPF